MFYIYIHPEKTKEYNHAQITAHSPSLMGFFFLSTLSILQMQYIYRPSKSKKWVTKEVKGRRQCNSSTFPAPSFIFFLLAFTCMATIMHSHDLFLFTWYFQKKLYFYFSQIPTNSTLAK